jgi:hypothetical protein
MKPNIPPVLIIFALLCFAVQNTPAVSPPPDGGYPGNNTAEGQNALLSLTRGIYNTAVGFSSLKSNTSGNLNTAIGVNALSFNTTGANNTANGVNALYSNTTGDRNTANGIYALFGNTTGRFNVAMGAFALCFNVTGSGNTAIGDLALWNNNSGSGNTAVGSGAIEGHAGGGNTALGTRAGSGDISGSNDIYIGAGVGGPLQESNTIHIGDNLPVDPGASACFIGGINGQTTTSGTAVFINSSGKLGTITSSARFKDEIKPMDKTSEAIFSLEPVTFRYKKKIDPAGTLQFGLVAENVEKINPDLVVRDKEGKTYSVRYEAVKAMLLNEFLKEHKKTEKLEATVASLIATVREQAAQIQKVSAQFEVSKPAPQVVNNP